MPARFVIIAQPRTGSTLVCSLLNSVPGVRCLIEPINPRTHSHHMQPLRGSKRLLPELMVQTDIVGAMELLLREEPTPARFSLSKKPAPVAAGFKIMVHQIRALDNEFGFWEHLRTGNIKPVLVFRYNILWQYVSDLITMATGQTTAWSGFDTVKRSKVTVPIATLGQKLSQLMREKRYALSQVAGLEHRRLVYEEFKTDYQTVGDMLPWLIGQEHKVTTRLQKQNPDDLRARVNNFSAVVGELHKLGLSHLIHERSPWPKQSECTT